MAKGKRHTPIPLDYPVQPLSPGQPATTPTTCSQCGLTWDDAIVTGITPTPAARCPFEHFHIAPAVVEVTTPYGDRYVVDCTTGRLTYHRRTGPTTEGSAQWTITGVADARYMRRHPAGLARLRELADMAPADLLFKNGNPRYTLTDLDHGTARTHGNTKYHGIKTVRRL